MKKITQRDLLRGLFSLGIFPKWSAEYAYSEYAMAINCTPAELTPIDKKKAWLNYVLKQSA